MHTSMPACLGPISFTTSCITSLVALAGRDGVILLFLMSVTGLLISPFILISFQLSLGYPEAALAGRTAGA